ncbi:uncharacterized protein F4822DRAFT_429393 [Hypoxylon trugodes]|uniref:uncharacterized protein n=1 Tax=Hypoxylon trugodes TaxID=326681 RepID=UPI002198CC41|nr:uncharacterized protein F4822DRAFT_429393 [Hypoxylon trugodes]KAI1388777.1 hypothetical protein F4822DRAFT_429393 [Hypoxylon trugodes]
MGSLLLAIYSSLLLFTRLSEAQDPEEDETVPDNFPKAFITAMVVAVICVVLLVILVCVFAHCWQHILGPRKHSNGGRRGTLRNSSSTSSLLRERWLEPVFEWPQQLSTRSRNNRRRRRQWQRQRDWKGWRGFPRMGNGPVGDERGYRGTEDRRKEGQEAKVYRGWWVDEDGSVMGGSI